MLFFAWFLSCAAVIATIATKDAGAEPSEELGFAKSDGIPNNGNRDSPS